MKYKVTAGILAYNGEKYFKKCFESLFKQNFNDFEIVVLDNASPNQDHKILKKQYSNKIRVIHSDKNLGFGKGHNKIMQESDSEYYFCLNQDMFFEPDFIKEIVSVLDKNPQAGSATGKLYRWDFENDSKTDHIDTIGIFPKKTHQFEDIAQGEKDTGKFDEQKEIFGSSGAAVALRRSALKEVGAFDPLFFMYKEDVELAYKLQWGGWKCVYTPKAIAYHDRTTPKASSILQGRKSKPLHIRKWSYLNHLILIEKNYSKNFSWEIRLKTWIHQTLTKIWVHIFERDILGAEKEFKALKITPNQKKVLIQDIQKFFI